LVPDKRKRQTPWSRRKIEGESLKSIATVRLEIAFTILMDGFIIAVSVVVRALLLVLYHWLLPKSAETTWATRALGLILDYGVVGTTIVYTVSDLLRRLRNVIADLRS
jgi:hypothetical protein